MAMSKVCVIEGRRPWYDETGATREPFLIGICGPSASGKTTLAKEILRALGFQWTIVVGMESFYKDLTEEELAHVEEHNFDHPDAFDWERMVATLRDLKAGKQTGIPTYDFKTHRRSPAEKFVYGVDIIIFEGILCFHNPEVAAMMDLKLFCDVDDDVRLSRRLRRDTQERNRTVPQVLKQYETFVKPCFLKFIAPLKKKADIIVPRGAENTVAVDLVTKQVQRLLSDRGIAPVVPALDMAQTLPDNVHVIPNTPRIAAMQTLLRDKNTSHQDFVFYSDRLVSILVENALSFLPFKEKTVVTPTGEEYHGEEFIAKPLAVSIMRGGAAMEAPLRHICKGIRIGKILIESDEARRPSLIYVKLPKSSMEGRHILLLDTVLASGATLTMAVHVLMDHGVKEENISFLTLVGSLQGLHGVSRRFPRMTIVAGSVDAGELSEKGYIMPGISTDRYFA